MKIGITCYPLIGGSGILATALGHELARRGHEVHFFSSSKPVRLDLSQPRIAFHEVVVNEYSLFRYPDYTLPLAVKMARVAREERLDIFHVHYAVPHATAAFLAREMLAAAESRPSTVTTLHGTDTTLLGQDPSYRDAIEHALRESDAITTVSASLRDETLATFSLEREIDVIPNFFVPTKPKRTRVEIRSELGVSENEFVVSHASNLRAPKRIDLLLRAFAAARSKQPMRLLILAAGPFAPHALLRDELHLREHVLVRDNVVEVEDYLSAADAGLYTSEHESFGLSILETLFHARPVVAFRVGGIPEVVSDGRAGFLHEFGDVEGMAASLVRLATERELARTMGEDAAHDARLKFSAERIVPIYEALYQRLML
ncbi:MAG: N-acetyl-alpha-D-glucosaminyl L-malate synthase BshA [Verrucomicrobiota bacterium]|nr:N-acetyl-alpha-D-glucosaminyl L-malate synthase BshA [Verrucomicrobiota bacterium]